MYRTGGVLALLALYLGMAQSFSWDIVVAAEGQLQFYDSNGTRTHIEDMPSYQIRSLAYDPVHNCVLFAHEGRNNYSIASFDLTTRKIINLVRSAIDGYVQIAYDPITSLLFWIESGSRSRKLILSKPIDYTNADAAEQNVLIKLDPHEYIYYITVDICGGYIYWITKTKIEKARFDGSKREVVINQKGFGSGGIAIDHLTRKIYWIDNLPFKNTWGSRSFLMSVESADLNGENRKTLYIEKHNYRDGALLVSKDFLYWRTIMNFSQLTRNPPHGKEVKPKYFSLIGYSFSEAIASNYKIEDQTQGIGNCEAQKSLQKINSETNDCASLNVSTDVSFLCVHGTKLSGESRCECTQGYIGERCEVSVCHNYCLQGDCTVSPEGQPKCRCNAGYSGERCEVSTPSIVTGAASYSDTIDTRVIISQELNNTLKGWRIDMDHAIVNFIDDIKGTLRDLRDEMEIGMSKLNDSIKSTLSDMKQEMNTLRSELEKLKGNVRTVADDVSELKSALPQHNFEQLSKRNLSTSSDRSQTLVSSLE